MRIDVDGQLFEVREPKLTGRQVRELASIPDRFDLYVHNEMAEYDDSREVGDNELVPLYEGLRFFSADPRDI